jgi:hypothetical protein
MKKKGTSYAHVVGDDDCGCKRIDGTHEEPMTEENWELGRTDHE